MMKGTSPSHQSDQIMSTCLKIVKSVQKIWKADYRKKNCLMITIKLFRKQNNWKITLEQNCKRVWYCTVFALQASDETR